MIGRLRNMFRVPDLRNKVLFTLLVIAAYRIGSHIPVPFVDFSAIQSLQASAADNGVVGFLNLFSGGAITSVSVFFLGVMPYITASIIMQLLGVVIPKLEEWQNEGQSGQKKITQWTRYVTMGLAIIQSTGFVFALKQGNTALFGNLPEGVNFIPDFNAWRAAMIVLVWTAGTALVMWLAESITQRGIGNGMSILIFASVVSRLPSGFGLIFSEGGWYKGVVIFIILIGMVAAIVYVESGQRRIPVQFAKRVVGRRMFGGQSTYIPLKVNQSGVIPVIFASSILSFPALIATATNWQALQTFTSKYLVSQSSIFYMGFYTLLIVFFAYFYTAIAFNPAQQADIIRKQGGFIPGIRPGPPTERYLAKVLNRITLPGSLFLAAIALTPLIVFAAWSITQFPFGGTSLLITVGVALETMKQIDSQLMMRNYEGFLA
ncbi:MAG: preprotein translocase subunit SecY [Actinobacteria bacterium]|uniref:Protein translocase subunit SecY n=1 Tax=freshwater metagenome TaxID=449393 RepID=A0A6J7CGF4_9ZZZZ|nr:preprotein translocase subunit SecY [Actinomycetota bacterium]MSW04764.1 preprotein translocase subunit SecY [Actinomycetota bacterium]MSX31960.1 preprotein translocase subunit SecY [Actinomycetota bacterium]MSX81996.1 preprotein translocase subunit SecY [Actinomycetota bacterium]MSY06782.1 preprotein translocase subunit SecY [Actinomycetota bacterium]